MAGQLRFDGQVAVITGAGGGLGREYALLLAERGAAVLVNDLGSGRDGLGHSRTADAVVQLIRDKGGQAEANYDSVEEGEKIVAAALEHFGRLDILINNAGILRDRSLLKMEDTDWDLVQRVHLRGAFVTTRAAWPHMRRQRYGRVLLTSSAAGLFGNFGQANYSSAKMGLVGLGKTIAREGQNYGILCNILVPAAISRLTEELFPPEYQAVMGPALVAPVAVALCHRDCPVSGAVVEAAGGAAATYRWQRSRGLADPDLTPEQVLSQWQLIDDHPSPLLPAPASTAEQMALLGSQLAAAAARSRAIAAAGDAVDVPLALSYPLPAAAHRYEARDAILYALSIGVSLSEPQGLQYLYEAHETFTVHPMFAALLVNAVDLTGLANLPGFPVDLTQVLHGEQYMELYRPLPPSGPLDVSVKLADIVDKGDKGALLLLDVRAADAVGTQLAYVQMTVFVRGAGGFGGRSRSDYAVPCVPAPQRPADCTLEQTTGTDQAALYRLSGDRNPLHIDPEFAALGGQSQPILHGLCALGCSVHALIRQYAATQPHRLSKVKARFSRPVVPGQTLLVDAWREEQPSGAERVLFQTRVKETGQVAVTGGYIELRQEPAAVLQSRL